MSRYIKTDALEQHKFVSWTVPEFYVEKSLEQQAYQLGWNNAIEAIMENEPTADVVEVVRCKDCKHLRGSNGHDRPWCGLTKWMPNGITRKLDDYCSYGERREDDEVDG